MAVADAEVLACAACDGAFVPQPLMSRISDARDPMAIALLDAPRVPVPRQSPKRRMACPSCRGPMAERPFEPRCAVLVDECAAHGVWFDRGELREVASFVASGGFPRVELARPEATKPPRWILAGSILLRIISAALRR
ncbi:MAG: zf-TFIIB domain-containing protein [Deltaproteobacteria bacterium]|nr:zf-TFIIB domain-containing protein [Deltaproteobacteria bacterium]